MKVVVYAICKNEEKFAEGWVSSMSEADEIYVLDTGSTDGTVPKLRDLGVNVTVEEITPWRFDTARNRSLDLVPEDADICVCTDLDEVFRPGWRREVETAWQRNGRRLHYRYTWNFLPDGREGVVFYADKIHARRGCRWVGAVHEVLWFEEGDGVAVYAPGVRLEHHADPSKSRGQYLPLLELAVAEDPENHRNVHYLGREYYFHRRWADSEAMLKRHLTLPTATWADERCASMRLLAKVCLAQNRPQEAEGWLFRAVGEAPHLREPWMDLATLAYQKEEWLGVLWLVDQVLAITQRPRTYITEPYAWGEGPWDLASLGYYYTGQYGRAVEAAEKALSFAPEDERIRRNWERMKREAEK